MMRVLEATSLVVAVCVGLVLVLSLQARQGSAATPQPGPATPEAPISYAEAVTLGAEDAPVVLMAFSDFQCPFCGLFARTIWPAIRERFVESGEVLYVFRHFPLPSHVDAAPLAALAECARGEDEFWGLHDRLFSHPERAGSREARLYLEKAGGDAAMFEECVGSHGRAAVQRDLALAIDLGLTGTPAFVIGVNRGAETMEPVEVIGGVRELAAFESAIAAAVGRAR